jgi:hypothetical protein
LWNCCRRWYITAPQQVQYFTFMLSLPSQP